MSAPQPLPHAAASSKALRYQIASLLIYQGIFDHPLGRDFLDLLNALDSRDQIRPPEGATCLNAYGRWFRRLAESGQSWQDFLLDRLLGDDNPFSRQVQRQELETLPASLTMAAHHDLNLLQQIYGCSSERILAWVVAATQTAGELCPWHLPNRLALPIEGDRPWGECLEIFAAHYQRQGVGLLGQYRAFRWQSDRLVPIAYPDPIQLDDLVGYDSPQQALCHNTECLLQGLPALNILLYGSRGSGKSSLVKGLLNRYGDHGLRLVEVALDELTQLPMLVERLRDAPQKFIIFVDDLSFEEDDERFKQLKVALEGDIVARPANVVIYATSNRRHLIREFFGDRPAPRDAEEIQAWDTVQEKLSFRDRFGLTLTFPPANQDTYLQIVRHLAHQGGLTLSPEDLDFRAKQWATQQNGRSGRTARQLVDYLIGEQGLQA